MFLYVFVCFGMFRYVLDSEEVVLSLRCLSMEEVWKKPDERDQMEVPRVPDFRCRSPGRFCEAVDRLRVRLLELEERVVELEER